MWRPKVDNAGLLQLSFPYSLRQVLSNEPRVIAIANVADQLTLRVPVSAFNHRN